MRLKAGNILKYMRDDMPLWKVLNLLQQKSRDSDVNRPGQGTFTPRRRSCPVLEKTKARRMSEATTNSSKPQEPSQVRSDSGQQDGGTVKFQLGSTATDEETFTVLPAVTVAKQEGTGRSLVSINQNGSSNNLMRLQQNGGPVFNIEGSMYGEEYSQDAVVSIVVKDEGLPRKETKKYEGFDRITLLSALYAVTVIMFGLVFPVTEALKETWFTSHIVGAFMVYLYSVSVIFLLYLLIFNIPRSHKMEEHHIGPLPQEEPIAVKPGDIVLRRRRSSANFNEINEELNNNGPASGTMDGVTSSPQEGYRRRLSLAISEGEAMEYINLTTATASLGHEGTSFYLRLGAVAFGIGNLIFVGLNMEYYMGNHLPDWCTNRQLIYPMFFHMAFILVQTFFLFKHSRIHVEFHKPLVRFGLMHVLATNMCVWLRVLVEEVSHGAHDTNGEPHSLTPYNGVQAASDQLSPKLQAAAAGNSSCIDKTSLLKEATPYLFPLVLEYSLIALATMYAMASEVVVHVSQDVLKIVKETLKRRKKEEEKIMQNINSMSQRGSLASFSSVEQKSQTSHQGNQVEFDKAHIGLFFGIVVLAGMVIAMIIFFHSLRTLNDSQRAQLTYQISNLTFHVMLLLGVIPAGVRMFKLAYSYERHNTIDDMLMVVAMAAILIFELFVVIAEVNYTEGKDAHLSRLSQAGAIFTIIQTVAQTWFIMDGLHRYSNTDSHQKRKPGRGLVTFLIIANLGMWAFKTFQVKDTGLNRQQAFYGAIAWNLIMNISLPLMLFYRFHSTVCLADIWHAAYIGEHGN